jgi:hypothetical protein
MPFLAECVFCKGKVRVPDYAVGQSVACPRCGNAFTLAPMTDPPAVTQANLVRPPSGAATIAANPAPCAESEAAAPIPQQRIEPAALVAAFSLFLASAAAIGASFPQVRPMTLALGCGALVCGLGAWRAGPRGRTVPAAVGVLVSLPVLLIAGFWPYLLTTAPVPAVKEDDGPLDTRPVIALTMEGEPVEKTPEWIDASKHSVQQGDLRVRVLSAVVKPAFDPVGPKAPPRYLHIALRLTNVGSGRDITHRGWAPREAGYSKVAVLHDNNGMAYKAMPTAPNTSGGLRRTSSLEASDPVEQTLVFEPPPESVAFLRLELPAAAAGGAGVLRLQIPKKMMEWR